ncbi:hypothetical protein HRM2_31560 [Desulforapulum autotrophicum HRM2]|uniref:Uncharacterized protein n=1 Tax=Desulforapulum autotrophicum (strain ATCC 43914 / DSM 3382 / VKM B-1955 / HRM2) TaxID=177437 RepID=C0QKZ9_DESAH|nr:hypothetical protein [Desulforapulum autotrophicum]ACN16239.1 hypothetical protein HRM2_31560 [Desulforapulum autotrophicum HRM2]
MKQKFAFEIDAKKGRLKISESAESDPGTFVPLHFEEYDVEALKSVLGKGQAAMMEMVRRKNFFPPNILATKLFAALSGYLEEGNEEVLVVDFDDTETLEGLEGLEIEEEDEDVDLDGLLTSDDEDLSEDDIKEIDSDDDTPKFHIDDDSEQEN